MQVLRGKYKVGNDGIPAVQRRKNCSNVWKGISGVWNDFQEGLAWRVGNGQEISLWKDKWIPGCDTLESYLNMSLPNSERERKVRGVVDVEGKWKLGCWEFIIPIDIVNRILLMPTCRLDVTDTLAWEGSKDGNLTMKTAYLSLVPVVSMEEAKWRRIWKLESPPKIKSFLWLLSHDKIKTRHNLLRRHIVNDDSCPFGCGVPETSLHCLRDCKFAIEVWKRNVGS